jgi:DNA-binding LacI/PurR family transcriptional regulator
MHQKTLRSTIKEVASVAGVSTQTVSRVINERPDVSPKTRQRVKDVIKELSYQPSALARSLRQVGPSRTLSGIVEKADELGYMLFMKELGYFSTDRIDDVIDSMLARHVDGILWVVPEIADNHAWVEKSLDRYPVPVLFITMQPRTGISSISTDNYMGAVIAVNHLLSNGRKNIGHISGPLDWWEAKERKRGWVEALTSAGYSPSENHCAEGDWSPASGARAFNQLLDNFSEIDALFVGNDQMALSVLKEAFRRNIHVPGQLAVIGFDNIVESEYFQPSLTTISQDLQALGEQSVQNIVNMIRVQQENKPIVAQSKFIQPVLVIRESTRSN